jgi:hypothetical protein
MFDFNKIEFTDNNTLSYNSDRPGTSYDIKYQNGSLILPKEWCKISLGKPLCSVDFGSEAQELLLYFIRWGGSFQSAMGKVMGKVSFIRSVPENEYIRVCISRLNIHYKYDGGYAFLKRTEIPISPTICDVNFRIDFVDIREVIYPMFKEAQKLDLPIEVRVVILEQLLLFY